MPKWYSEDCGINIGIEGVGQIRYNMPYKNKNAISQWKSFTTHGNSMNTISDNSAYVGTLCYNEYYGNSANIYGL